jgi:hypothetical protein
MSANESDGQDSTEILVAGDDGEILTDGPEWVGPFTEYDRYGEPTGHTFVRCPECGVDVLEGETEHTIHRAGCDGVGATSD